MSDRTDAASAEGVAGDAPEVQIRGAAARAQAAASPTDTCAAPPPADGAPTPEPYTPEATIPTAFRPPARGADGDPEWGLGEEVAHGADETLTLKLAHFHKLKEQGTHFNATLARNRSFHNPHIYAKLVKWADLDETGSNYVPMARAAHSEPSWDVQCAEVVRDGNAAQLAKTQKQYVEGRERAQASGQRSHIDFAGSRERSSRREHPYRSRR
ncbi:uncharacterized protein MJAP1_004181 [Malassezia japonica]|uniref:HCNGP-like protein n=1 Tax=Malassezia japonica TaxID=223818 RepID=A0AAF0F7K9_9BASI|nr:uncharacterized protein MJAP1_004181 [Malassezia japonica]WFD41186.1 hypothetical protein MJAP1_004181 [Malassezia japonica]